MNRLSVNLTRNALLAIYKPFIRSHREYGDILYDNQIMKMFKTK